MDRGILPEGVGPSTLSPTYHNLCLQTSLQWSQASDVGLELFCSGGGVSLSGGTERQVILLMLQAEKLRPKEMNWLEFVQEG